MIRKAFRRGLSLGLLGGAVLTAVKTIQSRRAPAPAGAPPSWDPIPDTTPVVVPPAPAEPVVEVHTGTDAEEHFADASRQVERPLSDWEPTADLPPATEASELAPPAVEEKPAAPAKKKAAAKKAPAKKKAESKPAAPWVEPTDGACPGTHPVKAKLSSKIFHVPGGFNYPRTVPDRCYLDAAAAEADGLRQSKR